MYTQTILDKSALYLAKFIHKTYTDCGCQKEREREKADKNGRKNKLENDKRHSENMPSFVEAKRQQFGRENRKNGHRARARGGMRRVPSNGCDW